MRYWIIASLIVLGGLLYMDIRLPHISIRAEVKKLSRGIEQFSERRQEKDTAADYVARLNGTRKDNFVRRSYSEAKNVYTVIGQQGRYQTALEISLIAGVAGFAAGLLLGNIFLACVLAVGQYFLPLWLSRFVLYRYQSYVNDELSTSLQLITTSYTRSCDLLSAVKENLPAINEPVKSVFVLFCNGVEYVDASIPAQIELMKSRLDNKIFGEWCDCLILCQADHNLASALNPIVSKFSHLKAQQELNNTRMMEPVRYSAIMTALVVGFCPLLKLLNEVWFDNLMHTIIGQIVLAITAIIVFFTINKGIRISEPITYDV